MAICSHCGNEARANEQVCQYCGRELLATGEAFSASTEAIYAASGAPLNWNNSQPQQVVEPSANGSNGSYNAYGATKAPQARLMVRPSPTAEPGAVIDDGEREFLLDGRDIAVGRAPSCDIVLAGDQLASRRHALLRLRDDTYTVVDLGSSNGTYVNDEEIHAETSLNDGDRVTVGGHDLVFSTSPASSDASVAGTLPVQPQTSTLLETAPIPAINMPPVAPPANAWQPASNPWQQPQDDAPLAEPDQLEADAADEDEAQPVDDVEDVAFATQAEVLPVDEAAADEAPAEDAPEDDAVSNQTEMAYFDPSEFATPAVATDDAPEEAATDTVATDVAAADTDADAGSSDAASVAAVSADATSAEVAPAAASTASADDLDALRSQLAEISTALSRKADEEYKLAGRLRAALVEVRDQLTSLTREHGGGSYNSTEATQDYSRLATIARQAADHPRHLDYLSSLSDAAGEMADALEAKQDSATGGGDSELMAGIEALRARLDETLG